MDEAKSYKTAGAFRTALENRLQTRAREEGTDLQRVRRQVAFDRFLARMFSKGPKAANPWVLKGGYAMELRLQSARTTKDLDLTLHDGTHLSKDAKARREQVRAMLQEAAAVRFDDYFRIPCRGSARRSGWRARRRQPLSGPGTNGRTGFCMISCERRHRGRSD